MAQAQRTRQTPAGFLGGPGRAAAIALVAIVGLAVVVRAGALGSRLHVDDAYSWWVASSSSAGVFLHRLAATENTPPLFYLLLMPFTGGGPAVLRLPAAVPGVLVCIVSFYAIRPRLGTSIALTTALGLAVAPFLVTYSDLARGFMLADVALLCQLWALLALGEQEQRRRWACFVAAGVIACYTEYASAIVVVAMVIAALVSGRPRRRPLVIATGVVFACVLPWLPEIVRAQNQVGITKIAPPYAEPTLGHLRDLVLGLTFGENDGVSSHAGRWLLFVIIIGALATLAVALRRRESQLQRLGSDAPALIRLFSLTAVLSLVGAGLAGLFGINVFTQRYLTVLLPIVVPCALAGLAVLAGWRAMPIVCGLLAILGVANAARRFGAEYEPSFAPVRAAVAAVHPATVLTDTPLVLYSLPEFHPAFDRPSNLGPGLALRCARPCVVVDDLRSHGGSPRPMPAAQQQQIGPYLVSVVR